MQDQRLGDQYYSRKEAQGASEARDPFGSNKDACGKAFRLNFNLLQGGFFLSQVMKRHLMQHKSDFLFPNDMSAAFPCAALVGGNAAFKVWLTSERVSVREADITSGGEAS